MKVPVNIWAERLQNLIDRRKTVGHTNDNFRVEQPVADYAAHMRRVEIGATLLDVGCGSMHLKNCIPPEVEYYGMDAVPLDSTVFEGMIESPMTVLEFTAERPVDTVCAFAVMDGCQDFDVACSNIKLIARKNAVFLSGIGINPDQFHTHRLELSDYRRNFEGWTERTCVEVGPKVYLLEYTRP